jgi:hypothetical protein
VEEVTGGTMVKVAAVKADSYDPHIVGQAITDLLAHLGGMSQFIQPGDRFGNGSSAQIITSIPILQKR